LNSTNSNRETIKRILSLPADTVIVWKSHDDSIAQRSAIDQARNDKGVVEKRRPNDTVMSAKEKVEA
jgi:translation initiation factor 4E